jgi:mRNA interferase MazF
MSKEGKILLLRFPYTNGTSGKLRPALVLRKLPGPYGDWLVCMISTKLSQAVEGFDELITDRDKDFKNTGLKRPSVFRIGRLAVVDADAFLGVIGEVSVGRLDRIRTNLTQWLRSTPCSPV